MPCQKGPFSSASCTLDVCEGEGGGVVQENSCPPAFLSLIFIRGRKSDCVQLPKGLTVGTEPQQSPFVFLVLKGPAIVACRDSRQAVQGAELEQKPPPTMFNFSNQYCLSSPAIHPDLLAGLAFLCTLSTIQKGSKYKEF